MQIITTAVQRGGTGKTTTAAALAQAAAASGKRALLIDLDPQGNLSMCCGANMARAGSYDLITGRASVLDVIQQPAEHAPAIIPANWNLSTLRTETGSARRLQNALQPVSNRFDYIVIDTPPTAGELQYNALQAATGLIIPLQADSFSLQGLYQIIDTAQAIQQSNPALSILGFVLCRHTDRTTIARTLRETITARAAERGVDCLGAIRQGVAVQEAQAMQRSLYDYAPGSKPAADYMALFKAIDGKQ